MFASLSVYETNCAEEQQKKKQSWQIAAFVDLQSQKNGK